MSGRQRYRFAGRHTVNGADILAWEAARPLPGDSRSEVLQCRADWFWNTTTEANR